MSSATDLKSPEFLARLRRLELGLRARSDATQQEGPGQVARAVAGGIEFADYRPYASGDDLRHVDWNAYGRLDQLVVKQFRAQSRTHLVLLPDLSATMAMGTPGKLACAGEMLCALGWMALRDQGAVSLRPIGTLGALHTMDTPDELIESLSELDVSTEGQGVSRDLLNACLASLARVHADALMVIATDMQSRDGVLSLVRSLRAQQRRVLVLNIASPEELHPQLRDFQWLEDALTPGKRLRATLTPEIVERYRDDVARYRTATAKEIGRSGARCLNLCSDQPFEQVIPALARAGYLRTLG